jgi:cytochrome c oxidase subunit I
MYSVGKLFAIAAILVLVLGVFRWPPAGTGQYVINIKNRGYGFPLQYWAFTIGALLAAFAAVYYWFPILFSRTLRYRMSYLHFWFSALAAFGFLLLAPGLDAVAEPHGGAMTSQRAVIAVLVIAGISTLLFLAAQLVFVANVLWSVIYADKMGP